MHDNEQASKQQADLLKDFGSGLGLELAFNEDGLCLLMVDETIVSIRAMGECFVLYGMLGQFPENRDSGFWRHFLSLNVVLAETLRGAVTVDEDDDAVTLVQGFNVESMTPERLSDVIRTFVDQANHLIALLNTELTVSHHPAATDDRGADVPAS